MRRRDILAGAGLAATEAVFPAPAIAQGLRQLRMVTDWPEGTPGLHAERSSFRADDRCRDRGRIKIEVFRPVRSCARSRPSMRSRPVSPTCITQTETTGKRSRRIQFLRGHALWLHRERAVRVGHHGGGQELWDTLSGQFNIKPLLCTQHRHARWVDGSPARSSRRKSSRGCATGCLGWCRGAPAAGRHRGALPGGEIVPALKSGAIDASEWVGPWLDMAMGLHQAAGYYYYPGFHEPGTGQTVGINKGVWESFDASDRQVIEAVAACEYARSLAEFNANNARSLRKLRDEGTVKILKFDNSVLKASLRASARTSSPRSAPAMSYPRKSTRATSSSARRSWIGATSPNAPYLNSRSLA